jgi:hypothetical protein
MGTIMDTYASILACANIPNFRRKIIYQLHSAGNIPHYNSSFPGLIFLDYCFVRIQELLSNSASSNALIYMGVQTDNLVCL